ncbi:MAG: (2Fe-2S) ferredoxin domain-containing protein [Candidatus Gracilibacteria bacterium]|nr:(2Fe-2S) ferredoxin domain-containing protein [Candidatus Gracilibacteria bacterium]MDQ7023485.1 (2Fe-2S) ferredoxin domain-containing protein [Candidatus Gracilibacteria bacterium]
MTKKIIKIQVCRGKTCRSNFSEYITKRLKGDIERLDLKNIIIEETLCMGMCKKGPNVKVDDEVINYAEPAKISDRVINGPKKKKKINNKK